VPSPRIATGTPRKYDWDEVVTFAQLMMLLEKLQVNNAGSKCVIVR
jgi:hypothetical protein